MNILHVTQGYHPALGGTEWMMRRLSEELVREFGDQVTVFTTDCYSGEGFFNPSLPRMAAGVEQINGVTVRRFRVSSWPSKLARHLSVSAYTLGLPYNQYLRALASGPVVAGLAGAIRAFPADVVMASSFPLLHMFATVNATRRSKRPCVLHGGLHPQDDWGFNRPMIYQAIRRAEHYIANTPFEARYVIERGADPAKVTAVGLGVDYRAFEGHATGEARRRLGLPEDRPVVGYIGQLGHHKGIHTLIEAMPTVWHVEPEATLLIAGARAAFAGELEQMVARLPEEQRRKVIFRFNFPEEDKPWLFAALDVFAYPSGYESFGIAFLEAWSAAKPVIGCWRGAVPDVVQSGRDGLLVAYQDREQLAEAVILLLHNPGWAGEMGENGRRKVHQRYNWGVITREFREIYRLSRESI